MTFCNESDKLRHVFVCFNNSEPHKHLESSDADHWISIHLCSLGGMFQPKLGCQQYNWCLSWALQVTDRTSRSTAPVIANFSLDQNPRSISGRAYTQNNTGP